MSLKVPVCLLFFCLLAQGSFGQNSQTGLVREFNSNKEPMENVGVEFFGAGATLSGVDGRFVLNFGKDKVHGSPVILQRVIKSGYEIVNETDLKGLRFSNDGKLARDIVLAKNGVIDAAKAEYAGASLIALSSGYARELDALMAQLEDAKLSEEAYQDQIKTLSENFEIQKVKLDALAATFARVNFDDAIPIYQEALELYKEGKLKEAIATLETVDLAKQTKDILAEIKRIDYLEASLDEDKKILEEKKNQHIDVLSSLANMYAINFDPIRAEGIIDTLLLLDGNDLMILQKSADFYREQHRYEKAKNLYPKIIAHENSQEWRKANALGHLGDLEETTGNLNEALFFYQLCLDSYQNLYESVNSSLHKQNLSATHSRMGDAYTALGNLEKALRFYQEDFILSEELYLDFPDNVSFKYTLAISYSKLGVTHAALGNLEKALNSYLDETILFEDLYQDFPDNVSFKHGLAISYSRMGETYTALGNLEKALGFYQNYFILSQRLNQDFPNNVSFKDGLAISFQKLGEIHTELGNLDKALECHQDENILFEELFQDFPNNVSFKRGLAISYSKLGVTHIALGNLEKALRFYQEDCILSQNLYQDFPDNVSFKNRLAISFQKLGEIHTELGNLDKALEFHQDANLLYEEIFQDFPDNVSFKNGLAISFQKLGEIHTELGNLDKALEFHQDANLLYEEIFEDFPYNVSFKNGLAISYHNLAYVLEKKEVDKAIEYLKLSLNQYQQLVEISPQNWGYQNNLSVTSKNLKKLQDRKNLFESEKIRQAIQNEPDSEKRYILYGGYISALEEELASEEMQVQAINSTAWYALLSGKFNEAEILLRRGIALDSTNKYLYTNLPPALLMQGKAEEAISEYLKWADIEFGEQDLATYKDAFLADFIEFENAGIIPEERKAEVERVRAMLIK